ncbi:5-formyltetrahydrofolate cyclo-ligase [Butyrivibrio proteoclasticus]|uniref:5-formyltetrahydrofolate cyclo-ligase n=1 Tax=Butyrivibrio proteoclasticus TaxID=43305 RepID=UPI00047D45CD|nr:5-formyltetrahydrofolate cyclo-ligase [Butyrivibrio proteoclasticus]
MDKDALRKEIMKKRDGLSSSDIALKSKIIADKLFLHTEYVEAQSILIYASMRSEVTTDDIIIDALGKGKNVFCPICTDKQNGIMEFVKIQSLSDLYEGYFGIREPRIDENSSIYSGEVQESTLCIVPGVAFDKKCNRIGYKGGYYDRYFERFPKLKKLALAFDEQIVDEISVSEYDVPVDAIITDSCVLDNN